MSLEAKIYYGQKFFPHFTPPYQLLAIEAILRAHG